MITISGIGLGVAAVAAVLAALVDPVWGYVSLVLSLASAAVLTVGVGRLARRG